MVDPAQIASLVRRQHDEVWSNGNLAAIDELFGADFVAHHPGAPDWIGLQGVRDAVTSVRAAFPDFHETIHDLVVADDRAVTRFTASGTQLGRYRGLPATGRQMAMDEMAIFRLAGGLIVEKWGLVDRVAQFQQLGIPLGTGPATEFLYDIAMETDILDIGITPSGHRRIVRVKGGSFEGPRMRGEVLPGGGDWLLERPDGSRALDVRITLRTHEGELIYSHYHGLFRLTPEIAQRLARDERVDPADYYFRTAPLFETASETYSWLNGILAVGIGRRTRNQVAYSVYEVL